MPRVAFSLYTKQTEEYEETIFGAMGAKRLKNKDLAKRLQKSESTVSRKLKDIDSMTFGEMRDLASYLGLEIKIGEKGNSL